MDSRAARITIGYEFNGRGEDITEQVGGEVLHFQLSNGRKISVETWERSPGEIAIVCENMIILPEASNRIRVVSSRDY